MNEEQEEELMGLYAIAREELKGIESARFDLKKASQTLEGVAYQIRVDTKTGLEGVLSHFKNENDLILKRGIDRALNGLLEASKHASESLNRMGIVWALFFSCFGMVSGAAVTFYAFSSEFDRVRASQRQVFEELREIKARLHPEKSKLPHSGSLKNRL
jgi:hypothetical protein